jgi:hypothetical protein
MFGSFAIAVGVVAWTVAAMAYPMVGLVTFGIIGFLLLWGLMDSLFGHHFRRHGS